MSHEQRTILHVDMDAFFASVEQILHPEFQGKPVIVGGTAEDRSVVASASYEARACGVKTAMPIAQAHRRCPQGVFLRGTYHEYQAFSARVEAILRDFTPRVQQVSIDDFYLDLTGCERLHGPSLPLAHRIRERIKSETGLNVSLGLASNRLVAKIAGQAAKPNGIMEVRRGYEAAFLRSRALDVIPGVGGRTLEALHRFNLQTAGDLARLEPKLLEATFGDRGAAMWRQAHGEDDSEVVDGAPPKSISRETTFEQDSDNHRFLEAMLCYLTERATHHLRSLGMQARTVSAKVRFSDFRTETRSRSLPRADDQDECFAHLAVELMRGMLVRRLRVRLIGVCLSNLRPLRQYQGDLWTGAAAAKRRRLHDSVDHVRDRFGFSILTAGRALSLMKTVGRDDHGFRLRTSCLSR